MPTYFSLYNCALAGAAAGMSSQKQALTEINTGDPVTPADSDTLLVTCAAYAAEVDALLVSLTPSTATNILDLVTPDVGTTIPTTSALADAAAYLPVVMALMSKSTFDGRGIPKDASGDAYDQAEWTASGIPNGVVAYFLAFSENVFVDGGDSIVKYVPLANVAMGAAMAGMISGRQDLYNSSGTPLTPSNFTLHVETARAFAIQLDASLQAASPSANVLGLVSGSEVAGYETVVPSTAALTNALFTLPVAIGAITKAAFDNRGLPKDASGDVFDESDYTEIANTVAAQFVEYAASVQIT